MVLLVCGPFTPSDSVAFEPLRDLVAAIEQQRPDVCVMVGPKTGPKSPELVKISHGGGGETGWKWWFLVTGFWGGLKGIWGSEWTQKSGGFLAGSEHKNFSF